MFRACRVAVALLLGWVVWTPLSLQAQQVSGYQAPVFHAPSFANTTPNFGLMPPAAGVWDGVPCPEPFPGGAVSAGREPAFRGSYFRAEYLDWNVDSPGDVLLGSQIAGVGNPRDLFPVTDPIGTVIGAATVPSTRDLSLDGNNGFRGTIGIEFFRGGAVEMGGFVLAKAYSADGEFGLLNRVIAFTPAPTSTVPNPTPVTLPRLVATSTLVNGQIGNNLETYNNSYQEVYQSQLASAEIGAVWDYFDGTFLTIKGLTGFKYVRLKESLEQDGVFTDTITDLNLVSEIDSFTANNVYGGMFGFRAEANWRRLTIGVQPRFGVGANSFHARVRTNNFRSLADGERITNDGKTVVLPMFDLGVYARFAVTRNLSLRVGYDLLWLGQVTRPEDNVYYNSEGPFPTPPDIRVNVQKHTFRVDGVSAGGELRF
jgi:hypothetical protein